MSDSQDFLQFLIRGRRCAMAVAHVKEVVAMPIITSVPLAGPLVKGVMPVRGHAIAVLDLGTDLSPSRHDDQGPGIEMQPRAQDEFVLVVEAHLPDDPTPARAAVSVDRVLKVAALEQAHVRSAPPGPPFVVGALVDQEGPCLIIDPTRAFAHVMAGLRQERPQ